MARVVLLNSCMIVGRSDPMVRGLPALRAGVGSLAGFLLHAGHAVSVLDPELDGQDAAAAARAIVALDPEWVGLPAYTIEVHDAAAIAREVRALAPGVRLVVGGYHPTALPVETLTEFPEFDAAIAGEAELPFAELLAGTPAARVAGLVHRLADGGIVANPQRRDWPSLDDYPDPAWDLFPDLGRYPMFVPVEAVRTCPHRCTFCLPATARKVRYRSVARFMAEVERLYADHGVRRFRFLSSGTFPLDRDHAIGILDALVARALDITWMTAVRVDSVDDELLARMRRAGCRHINLGIESGDPEVLRQCRKGIDLDKVEAILRTCDRIGIETDLGFLIGLPGETEASLRNTRRFLRRVRNLATMANFAILTPFPGTVVWDMAHRHEGGIRFATADWREYRTKKGVTLVHDNFTPRQLRRHQVRMLLVFYAGSPRRVLKTLKLAFFHDRGTETFSGVLSARRLLAMLKKLF